MVQKLIDHVCRLFSFLMVVSLALMVVMVFGNVVLRYGFNSGITVSEELSRWLFVWMTFLGAIVALRNHGHLGSDTLVSRLPVMGKKLCLGLSHLIMLYMWFRATWPRLRYDQLMKFAWKGLVPVALANIMLIATILTAIYQAKPGEGTARAPEVGRQTEVQSAAARTSRPHGGVR